MSTLLMTTKLYIPPPRPNLVPRPRLIQRLEDAVCLGHKLILISAPAGFGKTSLLSEWAARLDLRGNRGGSVAWLSLDEEDNDVARFWTYFIAALQTRYDHLGQEALQLLQGSQQPAVQPILTHVLNEIATLPLEPVEKGIVLILDDLHLISEQAIHEGLVFLLDHLPPQMHVVISTRADPPLPTHRLRARGQLTELRTNDLRFSPDEATQFLNTTMGLDLAPQEVRALEARTEGWVVGLQLAALSLQGRSDAEAFISAFTGSHHYVLEYLTEEVVRRQPESVQRFLVETSILESLSGPLCDAVRWGSASPQAGEDGSAAILEYLRRANLFVIPLDDEYRWYRYHHLFADLLANLLRKARAPEEIRDLHLRASKWYEQSGDMDSAIGHALQAEDFERAATLIEQGAQTLIAQGRLTTLVRWIGALPTAVERARPRLRLYHGWALNLCGQIDAAEQILQDTRVMLQSLPPSADNEALRGQLAALLTGIATLRKEMTTVVREAQEALAYLPEADRISRARVYVALGTAYAYEDKPQEATQSWQQARNLALSSSNPFLATAAIEMLAGTQIYHQGRLQAAAHSLQEVLELGTTPDGRRLPFTGTSHALLAEIYLEWDDLEAAAGYLDQGIKLQQEGGIRYGLIHSFCAKARLERARGDAEGAVQALQTAEQALETAVLWHMVLHLAACQVRLRLWRGDVSTAARWAEGAPATLKREMPETLPTYLREVQMIALARLYFARQEIEQVLATLAGLEEQAQAAGRLAHAIEISLLKALAWQSQGEVIAASEAFERSLCWAEPEGYVRLFLEAGTAVIPLLRRAASRGIASEYTNKLLAAFGVEMEASIAVLRHSALQPLPEPLTPRELEVLHLICDGLANQEIAERLTVTLNTVKKHSSHIYDKLGVSSRAQAMVRAHELGLC